MDKPGLYAVFNTPPGHPSQKSHQLTTVTDAEAECIRPVVKRLELPPYIFIETYYPCPSFCRIKHIGITEAPHKHNPSEFFQGHLLQKKILHHNVPWFKARLEEG